jgi:hypothetical protein
MRRNAGILVLLGMLGGCVAPHSDPQVLDMTATGQAAGSALAPVGRPRGAAGFQDWIARRTAGGQTDTAGPMTQGAAGSRIVPVAGGGTSVAALASRSTPGPLAGDTAARPAGAEPRPLAPGTAVVNSKRIQINYEIKDVGPSGLDAVELWYSHNRGPWQKYANLPKEPPFVIALDEEGLYGFTLVARNRAGKGKTRPDPNEPPQASVEVDLTRPAVEVGNAQYDPQGRTLTVVWQANDKNFGPQPVALSWAREPSGPWTPIITQLENTGRYVWKVPNGVSSRVWLQIEASDLAGNVSTAQTADAVALGPNTDSGALAGTQPAEPAGAIVPVGARDGQAPILTMEPLDQ